jgi:hypothetical protein
MGSVSFTSRCDADISNCTATYWWGAFTLILDGDRAAQGNKDHGGFVNPIGQTAGFDPVMSDLHSFPFRGSLEDDGDRMLMVLCKFGLNYGYL